MLELLKAFDKWKDCMSVGNWLIIYRI